MKKTIRKCVFETNSSSTHVLNLYYDNFFIITEEELNDLYSKKLHIKDNTLCPPDENSWSLENLSDYNDEGEIDLGEDVEYSSGKTTIVQRIMINGEPKIFLAIINANVSKQFRG